MSTGTGAPSAPAPPPGTPAAAAPPRHTRIHAALRVRNYRLFFLGQAVSNTGTWVQRIAQDWLVLGLTGSATAVGVTTALQFLPMLLLGLYGGLLVDRLPKRPTLLVTQSAMALSALFLAVLTLTDLVQVWHVYLAALAMGLATVVDVPARQSFVPELVGRDDLHNAVSLNSANFQAARLAGPALAGLLITGTGTGWAFLLNGLSFLAPLAGLLLMRGRELHVGARAPRAKGQLREGLRYVAERPDLLGTLALVGCVGTFGLNFPVFLSAFAADVFATGVGHYSLFNTLMAGGALAGALTAARRGTARTRTLIAAVVAFGLLEAAAAIAPHLWLFAALMVPIGVFATTVNVTANTSIQMSTDPEVRGRVMALYTMVLLGGAPVGAPIVGWLTDTYGARVGLAAGGTAVVVSALFIAALLARARRSLAGPRRSDDHGESDPPRPRGRVAPLRLPAGAGGDAGPDGGGAGRT